MAEPVLTLQGCAACSRVFAFPYPPPQRQTSDGRLLEPEPYFCARPPCQRAKVAREEREAAQARIGAAYRHNEEKD